MRMMWVITMNDEMGMSDAFLRGIWISSYIKCHAEMAT